MCDFVGKSFNIVGTSPWVNLLCNVGFLLDINLGVTRDTCREVGRKCDSLVKSVGVKRLSVSESGTHCFDTCAANVVERVLLGERPTRGLRVGTQGKRLGILGVELAYNLGPKHTCGTHLCDFHEEVHTDCPEERQAGSKRIYVHSGIHTCAEILKTVGKGVCKLDIASGTASCMW